MYQELGISNKVEELAIKAENELKEEFSKIERVCEINSLKVLKAFQDNNLSEIEINCLFIISVLGPVSFVDENIIKIIEKLE